MQEALFKEITETWSIKEVQFDAGGTEIQMQSPLDKDGTAIVSLTGIALKGKFVKDSGPFAREFLTAPRVLIEVRKLLKKRLTHQELFPKMSLRMELLNNSQNLIRTLQNLADGGELLSFKNEIVVRRFEFKTDAGVYMLSVRKDRDVWLNVRHPDGQWYATPHSSWLGSYLSRLEDTVDCLSAAAPLPAWKELCQAELRIRRVCP